MSAYLDTHIAVRLANAELSKLTTRALDTMGMHDLRVSPMVLLELDYLHELGKIMISAADIIRKLDYEMGLRVCDFSFPKIIGIASHETWTRDPFDRMIVAHAKANAMSPLISEDRVIRQNYLRAVW